MTRAWYTTRERVMRASDIKASAYQGAEIDAAIEAGAIAVDDLISRGDETRPGLAPWLGSITYDWPSATTGNQQNYRFWLGVNSLLSLSSAVSGGTDITANTYGSPVQYGAPYPAVEVDRGSASVLSFGSAAGQRSLVLTGLWSGAALDERTSTAWTLSGSATSSATTLTLYAPLGVGSIAKIDSERVQIIERAWVTSGQTGTLTASQGDVSLSVSNGAAFFAGETLLLDSEKVYIQEIAANTLTVRRADAGSVLAAHTSATIYWSRSFTVERGALGTTAASHSSGAQLSVYRPPALAEQLNIAYAQQQRGWEQAGQGSTSGSGQGQRSTLSASIETLEARILSAYGRLRHRAV